ncbi:MAG: SH3 domain-containing protein [Chloroflexota bacterium]|nr:SH3 domain-containing protein [Chloroflexota bacterium]
MSAPGGAHQPMRAVRALALVALTTLVGACTLPPITTPTPRPTPTASPTPNPTPMPASPTPTPEPTPDFGTVPDFAAGEIVASLIDGLRVRQRPGTGAPISTGLLPLGAEMEVVMGPFPTDSFGWYLVADADPAEPQYEEGWVAAGYDPDPFLRASGRAAEDIPYVASLAGRGNAEEGPMEIGEGDHAIRWIAADPERRGCTFAMSLAPPSQDPVAVIRATVGGSIDRGTLQPHTFDSLGVRGTVFATVTSDCDWALVIVRVPEAEPLPSASEAP